MRVAGWEDRLAAVIERHQALESVYGSSDCFLICDDAYEACTGARLFPDLKPYTTPAGAGRRLRERGFATVEDAFRSRCPDEVAPIMAQRGDIGVVEQDGEVCGVVFTALGAFACAPEGKVFLPVSLVRTAFKVV